MWKLLDSSFFTGGEFEMFEVFVLRLLLAPWHWPFGPWGTPLSILTAGRMRSKGYVTGFVSQADYGRIVFFLITINGTVLLRTPFFLVRLFSRHGRLEGRFASRSRRGSGIIPLLQKRFFRAFVCVSVSVCTVCFVMYNCEISSCV